MKKATLMLTIALAEYEALCRLRIAARVYLDTMPEGDRVASKAQVALEDAIREVESYH